MIQGIEKPKSFMKTVVDTFSLFWFLFFFFIPVKQFSIDMVYLEKELTPEVERPM